MTKENMLVVLERAKQDLFSILMDEAKKLENNQRDARLLAEEAFSDLKLFLKTGH